jgi:hypothetical protein
MDDKLKDIFSSRGINPDGVGEDSERTQSNKRVLDVMNTNANVGFFQKQVLMRFENFRVWLIRSKHKRQDEAKMQGQIELLLDDWIFQHNGPPKTPQEQANCYHDVVERMRQIAKAAGTSRQAREERAMDGPLGDFEDNEPMKDLPGDGDFRREIEKYEKKNARK